MKRGAQPGNNNPAKGKLWKAAINRALEKRSRKDAKDALDELAERLLESCDAKEGWAIKELGDRLDGKAAQEITGADGAPLMEVKLTKAQAERMAKALLNGS